MRTFFRAKVLLWPILLLIVVFVGATGAAAAFGAVNVVALSTVFGSSSKQQNDQVVRSVVREEKVVLLKLSSTGLVDKKTVGRVGNFDIPWTDRTMFMQYSFDALLGVDGKHVDIKPTGAHTYKVSIPEFIFIGADNQTASIAVEQNGALSWSQPEIDDHKMRDEIINDDAKAEHLAANRELLQDQAKAFYEGIIHGVDPAAEIEWAFAS